MLNIVKACASEGFDKRWRRRQVCDAFREVSIGRTIGQKAADQGDNSPKVEAISYTQERIRRRTHVE